MSMTCRKYKAQQTGSGKLTIAIVLNKAHWTILCTYVQSYIVNRLEYNTHIKNATLFNLRGWKYKVSLQNVSEQKQLFSWRKNLFVGCWTLSLLQAAIRHRFVSAPAMSCHEEIMGWTSEQIYALHENTSRYSMKTKKYIYHNYT